MREGILTMIADTCFIIDLMRKQMNAIDKLVQIEKNNESQYLTSPTVFELAVGVAMSSMPEDQKQKIIEIIKGFSVLSLTFEEAWRAGLVLGHLYIQSQPVDPIDAQIAGIALVKNQHLVTKNVDHFNRFPDLQLDLF